MWKVLIVEDDLKNYQNILTTLEKVAQCNVVCTGEEALLAYRESLNAREPYSFILLDITMPGINGFEVLQAIRQEEQQINSPSEKGVFIIVITAYKDSLMEYYDMGWDDFITKPVDADKLITHMQALMKTRMNV